MVVLSISGLVLDLVGVMLLGFDLLRIQRQIQTEARDRAKILSKMTDDYGGVGAWLGWIKEEAIWSEVEYNEGRGFIIPGTFDTDKAETSFKEVITAIDAVRERVEEICKIVAEDADINELSSKKSLRYSYVGLAAIFLGFSLQVAAYTF